MSDSSWLARARRGWTRLTRAGWADGLKPMRGRQNGRILF